MAAGPDAPGRARRAAPGGGRRGAPGTPRVGRAAGSCAVGRRRRAELRRTAPQNERCDGCRVLRRPPSRRRRPGPLRPGAAPRRAALRPRPAGCCHCAAPGAAIPPARGRALCHAAGPGPPPSSAARARRAKRPTGKSQNCTGYGQRSSHGAVARRRGRRFHQPRAAERAAEKDASRRFISTSTRFAVGRFARRARAAELGGGPGPAA